MIKLNFHPFSEFSLSLLLPHLLLFSADPSSHDVVNYTKTKQGQTRDEDPDTVGCADFWPVGSGSITFFIGFGF